jgi:serine/threonine protein kinase
MPADPKRVRDLFLAAAERPAADRPAFLAAACGSDADLRAAVERLLAAHDDPASVLQSGAAASPEGTGAYAPDPGLSSGPVAEAPGQWVGPYKLLQKIGEGGMGTVWMAEQEHPVKRRVALKVIKPGMDSGQVIARFEAERQALALMDHVNIAKVLDAGTAPLGRPYFVMELIKGEPITKFCDEHHLTPRERLELFIPVCQAVQHAHQKGVIHRDLKPSNVLVTLYDGRPVPKVIDFGVAKALHAKLTDRTLFTGFGAVVGTLEYMAPEQAKLSHLDVDTRSDVYSLGVLLYELLTGTTPFERQRLRQAALDEVLRILREEEPPKPSTRLSDSGEALPSIAAARRTEPAKLSRLVRGELDWIVMKALDKDRGRRYETANGFARDVQRYLADEPVEACPPGTGYRLRKFARKHQRAVTTAAAFAALLIAGVVVSSWLAVRAASAERIALERLAEVQAANAKTEQALDDMRKAQGETKHALAESEEARNQAEAVSEFLVKSFRKPDPRQDGRTLTVAALLEQAEKELLGDSSLTPATRATLLSAIGRTYQGLGLPRDAVRALEPARSLRQQHLGLGHPDTVIAIADLSRVYPSVGRGNNRVQLLAEAQEGLRQCQARLGPDHADTLRAMQSLADAYQKVGSLAKGQAQPMFEEVLRRRRATLGPDHPDTLSALLSLGVATRNLHLLEEALRRRRAALGPDHPDTLVSMNALARTYTDALYHAKAIPLYEEALRRRRAKLGPDHPDTLISMNNLAMEYEGTGRLADAGALFEEVLRLTRAKLGPDHPSTVVETGNLAHAYEAAGRIADALPLREEALRLTRAKNLPGQYERDALFQAYELAARKADTLPLAEEALRLRKSSLGADHPDTLSLMHNLARGHSVAGRFADAVTLLEELLRLRRVKLGPDHRDTIDSQRFLIRAYLDAGRPADALKLAEEMLLPVKANPGSMSVVRVSDAMHSLAMVYLATGRAADLLPLLEWMLQQMKARPVPTSGTGLHTLMGSMTKLYLTAGRFDDVLPLLEEAHQLYQAKGEPDLVGLVSLRETLASAYRAAGRPADALALYEEALRLTKAKRGQYDFRTWQAMDFLAKQYLDDGRHAEGFALLEEDLRLERAALQPRSGPRGREGDNPPVVTGRTGPAAAVAAPAGSLPPEVRDEFRVMNRMSALARAYRDAGRLAEARSLFEEELRQRTALGHGDDSTVAVRFNLAEIDIRQKKYAEAEARLRDCLATREMLVPQRVLNSANDEVTPRWKARLCDALIGQRKYAEAEPLLLADYERLKGITVSYGVYNSRSAHNSQVTAALERLVQLYEAWGKPDEAAKWKKELAAAKG